VPQYILEHFEFESYEDLPNIIKVHVVEKNDAEHIPKEIFSEGKAVLDGYMNVLELQSFPTLGKEVFIYLKRRRWKLRGTTQGYHNTYEFTLEGMKATKEFGAFLKEIGRR